MAERDEYTFLCGYQKIRRYGSTDDLNSPPSTLRSYTRLVLHKLEPTDTLQSLELKYNSCVFEIKRVNRLWSNDSLHCKTHVNVPVRLLDLRMCGDGSRAGWLRCSACSGQCESPQSLANSPNLRLAWYFCVQVADGTQSNGRLPFKRRYSASVKSE